MSDFNIFLIFGAGLLSVFSPCILPVLPIIVTGTEKDTRWKPLLIVGGLSLSFVTMGVLSTLFASLIGPAMSYVEKAGGIVIILFGLLMILDLNLFKHLTFFQKAGQISRGSRSAFFIGITLGVIWIPCVGPILSSVLTMVATEGTLHAGIGYLLIYSLGFSIPILLAGYASHLFRTQVRSFQNHPVALRLTSGSVIILLGLVILFRGMIAFGSITIF